MKIWSVRVVREVTDLLACRIEVEADTKEAAIAAVQKTIDDGSILEKAEFDFEDQLDAESPTISPDYVEEVIEE